MGRKQVKLKPPPFVGRPALADDTRHFCARCQRVISFTPVTPICSGCGSALLPIWRNRP